MYFEIACFCMLKVRIVVHIIPSQSSLMKILASSNVLLDLFGVPRNDIFLFMYHIKIENFKVYEKISTKHTICIHIDRKADTRLYEALESISKCFDNIILAKKREDVTYAHFTRLQVRNNKAIGC